jgi:opacity protein-like surface antigen
MKKTIILASVLGSLISVPAFAKSETNYSYTKTETAYTTSRTQGTYLGLDLIGTNLDSGSQKGSVRDNISYGVSVKHAFNFDKIFIAPGIFFDHNRADASSYNGDGSADGTDQTRLKYSYGVKADIGYDVTDRFAPFVILGYSESRLNYGSDFNSKDVKKTEQGLIYGVGAKYALAQRLIKNMKL